MHACMIMQAGGRKLEDMQKRRGTYRRASIHSSLHSSIRFDSALMDDANGHKWKEIWMDGLVGGWLEKEATRPTEDISTRGGREKRGGRH
mmetsp:Transcript_36387/g.71604  ORF Transcript_36387/g.71604 Transcript_36387/m.71604 type:complete len:90 (+) Transcript_36387:409-678(+)